jgi:hypothetical protein
LVKVFPEELTVMVTGVVEAPPHLSHSSTVVLYVPGLRVRFVLRLAPLTTYASFEGEV